MFHDESYAVTYIVGGYYAVLWDLRRPGHDVSCQVYTFPSSVLGLARVVSGRRRLDRNAYRDPQRM